MPRYCATIAAQASSSRPTTARWKISKQKASSRGSACRKRTVSSRQRRANSTSDNSRTVISAQASVSPHCSNTAYAESANFLGADVDCLAMSAAVAFATLIGPAAAPRRHFAGHEKSLLDTAAHALRNPLTSLRLSLDMLVHDFDDLEPEAVFRLVQRAQRTTSW